MNQPQSNPRFQLAQTTVRMTQEMVDLLDQAAREQFCSRGAIIRRALAFGLRLVEASTVSRNDLNKPLTTCNQAVNAPEGGFS